MRSLLCCAGRHHSGPTHWCDGLTNIHRRPRCISGSASISHAGSASSLWHQDAAKDNRPHPNHDFCHAAPTKQRASQFPTHGATSGERSIHHKIDIQQRSGTVGDHARSPFQFLLVRANTERLQAVVNATAAVVNAFPYVAPIASLTRSQLSQKTCYAIQHSWSRCWRKEARFVTQSRVCLHRNE